HDRGRRFARTRRLVHDRGRRFARTRRPAHDRGRHFARTRNVAATPRGAFASRFYRKGIRARVGEIKKYPAGGRDTFELSGMTGRVSWWP
ncbi:MAG: hypothetical protein LBD64_04670, partial [Odoribacteraceae bacterium]|nr:hypothetical protein [Odoribacteraceae bacterium]